MKSKAIIVMMIAIAIANGQVMGLTQFNDGGTHDITTTINDDVWVDWESPSTYTTVNVLAGGTIPATYKLQGYNNSSLNISGGSVYGLSAYDSSLVNISSGSMDSSLYAYDSSLVNISGGWANSSNAYGNSQITMTDGAANYLYAYENSQITMSGGSVNTNLSARDTSLVTMSGGSVNSGLQAIGSGQVMLSDGSAGYLYATGSGQITMSGGSVGYLRAHENSLITISGGTIGSVDSDIVLTSQAELIIDGFNFAIDGTPVDVDEVITSIFGGNYLNEPYRRLTGTLANGGTLNNPFVIGDNASITLIPEPATLLLLGLGAVMLRKRNSN